MDTKKLKLVAFVTISIFLVAIVLWVAFPSYGYSCSMERMKTQLEDDFISRSLDKCLECAVAGDNTQSSRCKETAINAIKWLESDPEGFRTTHILPHKPMGSQLAATWYAKLSKLSSEHNQVGVYHDIFLAVQPDRTTDPVGFELWYEWGRRFQVIEELTDEQDHGEVDP